MFYFTHVIEKKSKEEGFSPPWKKKFLRYLFGGGILKRCSFSFQKLHMVQLKSQVLLEKYIFPWGKESNTSAMGFFASFEKKLFLFKNFNLPQGFHICYAHSTSSTMIFGKNLVPFINHANDLSWKLWPLYFHFFSKNNFWEVKTNKKIFLFQQLHIV